MDEKREPFYSYGSFIEEEYDVVLYSNKIVVDGWEVVKHRKMPILAKMFDEGLIKDENVYANLDEIVAGQKPYRETNEERIFFAPIDMAHEDVAFAYKVCEQAKKGRNRPNASALDYRPIWVLANGSIITFFIYIN